MSKRFTKSHEYIRMDGDVGVVGISDHAQKELGDVIFVELPEVGSAVTAGEQFGSIESVKAFSDLYSPVSGEVVEINGSLADKPESVNTSPYEDGWMIKVRLRDTAELDALMDSAAYDAWVAEES
ncbi:MAG: glycine cleavage system protein GcvH [Acidobacteria bacterium]|nr:glycine cleavage system protein GcvH [Acidobacteriota bacterium]